ncbi:MAG: hypothetical protein HON90_09125 [Halobacteriovoraceae bacterium]|jgi:hypothetical protein|nr:hypothetical protein [Halobacteriovoraceae bacterium]
MNSTKDNRVKILILFYSISFLFILLNFGGVYWDDWAIYNQDPDVWPRLFLETGNWLLALPLCKLFLSIGNQVYIFRIFTFIAFLMSSIFFLKTLDNLNKDKSINFMLALTFALIPLNSARISLVCIFYTAAFLLYSIFLYLYTTKEKSTVKSILMIATLFLSFSTNSLLFFHLILITLILYYQGELSSTKKMLITIKKNLIIFLAPFIFFIIKGIYLKPYGIYTNYNKITFISFFKGIPTSLMSLVQIFKNLIMTMEVHNVLFTLVFLFVFKLLSRYNFNVPKNITFTKGFLTGIILTLSGLYPYAVVGKVPKGIAMNSRFEILTVYGLTIIFVFLIFKVSSKLKQTFLVPVIFSLLITFFMMRNINIYQKYIVFWVENEAFESLIKANKTIAKNTSFTVTSSTFSSTKTIKKSATFYEYSGMSKKAFGSVDKLLSPESSPKGGLFPNGKVSSLFRERKHYNIFDYKDTPYQYHIHFQQIKKLTTDEIFSFLIKRLFNHEEKLQQIFLKHYKLILTKHN